MVSPSAIVMGMLAMLRWFCRSCRAEPHQEPSNGRCSTDGVSAWVGDFYPSQWMAFGAFAVVTGIVAMLC